MSATDKVILGTAATFGLQTDLNLVGQDYSWANSMSACTCLVQLLPFSVSVVIPYHADHSLLRLYSDGFPSGLAQSALLDCKGAQSFQSGGC